MADRASERESVSVGSLFLVFPDILLNQKYWRDLRRFPFWRAFLHCFPPWRAFLRRFLLVDEKDGGVTTDVGQI